MFNDLSKIKMSERMKDGETVEKPKIAAAKLPPKKRHKKGDKLSPCELDVFDLLTRKGMKQTEAAAHLGLSVRTIEAHTVAIKVKLGANTFAHAAYLMGNLK